MDGPSETASSEPENRSDEVSERPKPKRLERQKDGAFDYGYTSDVSTGEAGGNLGHNDKVSLLTLAGRTCSREKSDLKIIKRGKRRRISIAA